MPLLDMGRYHKLLAGASWMAEFGDPEEPADWAFLKNWSPYQCVTPDVAARRAPVCLFTTSTKDDRVHPAHARKMVKRLLTLQAAGGGAGALQASDKTFYWENIDGGHGGAADNKQTAFMWALSYAFLFKVLGGEAAPGGAKALGK